MLITVTVQKSGGVISTDRSELTPEAAEILLRKAIASAMQKSQAFGYLLAPGGPTEMAFLNEEGTKVQFTFNTIPPPENDSIEGLTSG